MNPSKDQRDNPNKDNEIRVRNVAFGLKDANRDGWKIQMSDYGRSREGNERTWGGFLGR